MAQGHESLGDWSEEEFRQAGYATVDWAARYLQRVGTLPVLAPIEPGDVRRSLPEHPPEAGEPFEALLQDLDRVIVPGTTHWNHPAFFAYFAITASAPGILAELAASTINTNAMIWRSNPASTELEALSLRWLAEMLRFPTSWFGQILDTASTSTLVALCAAREAQGAVHVRQEGLAAPGAPRLRMYASEEAHSSVEKAGLVLGLGRTGCRRIGVDERLAMRADLLRRAIREDRAAGFAPFAVTASVGTTSTTAVDPVREIADICRDEGLWLHVDAAYGGMAAIVPEKRSYFDGVELADSLVVNPHKWLFVPIDLSVLYTSRPDVLRQAFQLVPDYLQTNEAGDAINLMDYGFQLGRRFRALKLWWVIRSFGVAGIRARIAFHCELARRLESWIGADPRFELMAPVAFSTVCFRARVEAGEQASEGRNAALLERVNRSGETFLSQTRIRGAFALRCAIGNLKTEERHVRLAWDRVVEEWTRLAESERGAT